MRSKRSIGAAVFLAGGAWMLGGCAADTSPPGAMGDPTDTQAYPNVTVEPALQRWIVVRSPVVERGEIMKVTVPVRLQSATSKPIYVQYKFVFLDEAGVPLRVQSDWQFQQLEPRMERFLRGNALDSNADNWQVEIRSAR